MDVLSTIKYLLTVTLICGNVIATATTMDTPTTPFPNDVRQQKLTEKKIITSRNNLMTEANSTATDNHHEILISTSDNFLEHICVFLNISTENCHCQYLETHHINLTGICTSVQHETMCEIDSSIKAQVVFSIVASFIGIIGNSIVLIARSRSMLKSLHYRLIIGLAMADLLFSIAQAIYYIPYLVFGCKWVYGRSMCSILPSFLGISSALDVGFIVIIAAERYNAIVHPLKKSIPPQSIYMFTLLIVIVGVCSVIPMFLVLEVSSYGACVENWSNYPNGSLVYSWLLLIFFLILPVIVTMVLYCRSLKATLYHTELTTNDVGNKPVVTTKVMMENKRALIVISSLLIAFVLLNSPNRIVWLVINYMGHENLSYGLYKGLKILGIVPYSLHIMINPIIYSVVDKTFRHNVMTLCRRRKDNEMSDSSQTINLIFETTNV